MSKARLTAVTIERFKSFKQATRIELPWLTIILGRNNCGKSSLIQSLLLLKQTLADPRTEVMLRLDGMIDAFNLRELTHGWPAAADEVMGPEITLEWDCEVDVAAALANQPNHPNLTNLAKLAGVPWLKDQPGKRQLQTTMKLSTIERRGSTQITAIDLHSKDMQNGQGATWHIDLRNKPWTCTWNNKKTEQLSVELDHFIPILQIGKEALGPRSENRAFHNAYLVLFEQPLAALKTLLTNLNYLGSSRLPPSSLFKPATSDLSEIGVSGEFAAQLLHRRQADIVHFLPPLKITEQGIDWPQEVKALPLGEAVNEIMRALSIAVPLKVHDIEQVGFRLMFGNASIAHVGRGLGQLLPLVELGLFADPLRFRDPTADMSLQEYLRQCPTTGHIILEEPEAHLHPKVASRLAHWLVSLAQSNRQVIVETHSDHLVRRLRGLAARAGAGSALEKWLIDNVAVISVEQDETGQSSVSNNKLTADGGVGEVWPADFMDEATEEESAIYYAQLNKTAPSGMPPLFEVIEGEEPELDHAP
jgi:predicted ATPase